MTGKPHTSIDEIHAELCRLDSEFAENPISLRLKEGSDIFSYVLAARASLLKTSEAINYANSVAICIAGKENMITVYSHLEGYESQRKGWRKSEDGMLSLGKKAVLPLIAYMVAHTGASSQQAGTYLKCIGPHSFMPLLRLYLRFKMSPNEKSSQASPSNIAHTALDVMVDIDHPKKRAFFTTILQSWDENLVLVGLRALEKCEINGKTTDALVQLLKKKHDSSFIPSMAAQLLAKKGITAIHCILKFTDRPMYPYPPNEEYCADALARMGNVAVPILISEFPKRGDMTRKAIAMALGKIGDTRAVECLIGALGDSIFDVSYASVISLGKLKDARAISALLEKRASLAHGNPNHEILAREISTALLLLKYPPACHQFILDFLAHDHGQLEHVNFIKDITMKYNISAIAIQFLINHTRHEPLMRFRCMELVKYISESMPKGEKFGTGISSQQHIDFDSFGLKRFPTGNPRTACAGTQTKLQQQKRWN